MSNARLLGDRRRHLLFAFVWAALVSLPPLVVVLKLTGVATGTNFYDFGAYYNAAERVLAGHPLYDWTTDYPAITDLPNSPDRFLYAPITVLLFLPFAVLTPGVAAVAWVSLSAAAYVAATYVFLRSLDVELDRRHWAMLFAATLGFGPFVTATIAGQVSTVLAALVTVAGALAFGSDDDQSAVAVGVVLAVVVAFKPYYAPLGAVLLRDRRRLAGAVAAGVALVVAGLLTFGVETSLGYLGVLQQGKGWGAAIDPVQTWNINEYHPLYAFGPVHLLVRAGVFAAVAGVALYSRRVKSRTADGLVFSLGVCAFALAAPTVAPHALTVLVPVFLFILWEAAPGRDRTTVVTLGALALVHVHSYAVEFFVTFGPRLVGDASLVYAVVPVTQPAVWGVLILSGVVAASLATELGVRP